MLDTLDRHRRDSTPFQFASKRPRDFIDPKYRLIQIDEQFDFAWWWNRLKTIKCLDNGRPAIHHEVLVRALLISSLYNITSFEYCVRRNPRTWLFAGFASLTIEDEVFDHSTISYFIERVGSGGFGETFHRFNEELLRLGLLSRQMYADSSLVRASVSGRNLSPSGMSVATSSWRARRRTPALLNGRRWMGC